MIHCPPPTAAWEINWKSDKEHLRLRVLSWESIWWDNPDLVIHDQTFLQWPSEWSGDKLIRREKKKKKKVKPVVTCTRGSLGEL